MEICFHRSSVGTRNPKQKIQFCLYCKTGNGDLHKFPLNYRRGVSFTYIDKSLINSSQTSCPGFEISGSGPHTSEARAGKEKM